MADSLKTESKAQSALPTSINDESSATAKATPKKQVNPFFDHFNSRDLKIWFRCSVAFWINSLFVFIQPTLTAFGAAAFFGGIVTLFLPPNGVVLVFLLGGTTMLVGMGLGWAWGELTMKAALSTRSTSETLAREQMLGQQAQRTGVSAQILVYEGFMLDNRVTVTWFAMLLLFIYLMARLRMKVPKLALTAVFAWIVSDVFLTVGPLLPTFQGTIPIVLIKPAAAAIAVNLACSILIFPESTSHLVLVNFQKLMTAMVATVPTTIAYLQHPSDTEADIDVQKLRAGLIGGWGAVEPSLGFLPLDFSVGYWGASDIESLREPVKRLLISALTLLEARLIFHQRHEHAHKLATKHNEKTQVYGKHQLLESMNLHQLMHQPDVKRSVSDSFEALAQATHPLLDACQAALLAAGSAIELSNSRRWFGGLSESELLETHQKHAEALEVLRSRCREYSPAAIDSLLGLHEQHFDSSDALADNLSRHKLSGLFIGLTLEQRITKFAETVDTVLTQIIALEKTRTRRRLWTPSKLGKLFSWATNSKTAGAVDLAATESVPKLDKSAIAEMNARLTTTMRPAKKRSAVSNIILGTAHWLSDDAGIFAMRIVVATLAVGVIAANRTTAGFFYREKGLWALIMAQTGLVLGFADFTYGVVTRIAGTVCGGIIGMVGWYIGSGLGKGNPYGLAAVMAVLGSLLMYFRLWAPPQHATTVILAGATIVLVIGYGYIDGHNPTYGNPGYGYEVFWRRTVLIIIGFTIGCIVSLFPWPTSQSRSVAKALSEVLHAEADHYALLLTSWNQLEDDVRLIPAVEGVALHLAEILAQLHPAIENLSFEFSSSAFDKKTCTKIKDSLEQINRNLTIVHILGASLPKELRDRFAKATGLLHHRATADIMVTFAVIEQALKTGDALPSRMPTPLVVRCLEYGRNADVATLTKDMLRDRQFRIYAVMMGSYMGVLSLLDELVLVLKEELGEAYVVPQEVEV